ncbi:ROK family transcriptional regulator [Aquibacillus sediminis]|uniref:ROK family transcriptional regulator n=1 Tax=Aquibacillus sediminis TaxID=2574734 RepID=UPI001109778D|nr:ROK family transcriptional regulator [Aquibacillus sediminis]
MLKEFLQGKSSKHINIKHVYQTIHRYGPITKGKLIERTNLKQTTMVRILEQLLEWDLIELNGYDESSGGRPPALYQINPRHHYMIGIDLSRTHTKIMLVNLALTPIDRVSFPMTAQHTPVYTIDLIKRTLEEMLQKHRLTDDDVLGIGIGAVGPLDRENGIILEPDYFPATGWKHVAIVDELKKVFPQKVLLENGAHVAAIGEYYHSTIPHENILYCISGIGLRCGILNNGQFVQNKTGDASSFGQMIIHTGSESDSIGETLSSFISLESILEEVKDEVEQGKKSMLLELVNGKMENSKIEHVLMALKQNDRLVREVIMKSAYYYGVGLANIINVLHPDRVILSGILMHEFPPYYEKVMETAKQYIYRYHPEDVSFGKGELKEDAVAIGASVLIFDTFFNVSV